MGSSTGAPTLYQDWQARRDRLASSERKSEADRLQIQLLDYLLERYEGALEAQRPAAPEVAMAAEVNERAVVVHHHLQHLGGGPRSPVQAKDRVSSVLQRLAAHQAGKESDDAAEEPHAAAAHRVSGKLWGKILRRLRWGLKADRLMKRALAQSPYLPASALQHLAQRAARQDREDLEAVHLLVRCENRGVYDLAARIWRERILAGCRDAIWQRLEQFFDDPAHREAKLLRLRLELADERVAVRCEALQLLSRIGSLEDINLLADLLAIVPPEKVTAEEHSAILAAMQGLSARGA
jgi:hypothetical protein